MNYCESCGSRLRDGAHFCGKCGTGVSSIGTSVPAQAAVTPAAPQTKPPASPPVTAAAVFVKNVSSSSRPRATIVLPIRPRRLMVRRGIIGAAMVLVAGLVLWFGGRLVRDAYLRQTSPAYVIDIGDVNDLDQMLDRGVKPGGFNEKGLTPLMAAVLYGDGNDSGASLTSYTMCKVLLLHGADVNIESDNVWGPRSTALSIAAARQKIDIVHLLLDDGAAVNGVRGDNGTALCSAADNVSPDLLRLFIAHGANVNLPNFKGETALGLVKKWNFLGSVVPPTQVQQAVDLLTAAGAN